MDIKIRETILKIISITAMFLCVYPITSIMRFFLFKKTGGLLDAFFYLAVIYGTFAAVNFIMRKNNTKKNAILAHLFLVIPILVSLMYYFHYGAFHMIFGTFTALILCFFTVRAYFKKYHYLVSGVKIYIGIVMVLLALTFSTYLNDVKHLKTQFYIITFIYTLFLLIIKNQSNLDGIFSKRFDKASGIPAKMRSYNVRKTVVFFLMVLVFYCFRDVLVMGLRGLGNILALIIKTLWGFLSKIMVKIHNLFDTGEMHFPGPSEEDYGIIEGSGKNIFVDTIFNIALFLILTFIIYKIITVFIIGELIPFLKNFLKSIYQKLINLFDKTEYREEKTSYYTDSIERVLPSDVSKKSKEKKKILSINKMLKDLEKIQDPKEKIKYLYGFILRYMSFKGMDIKKSYTTGEIYKRAEKIPRLNRPFGEITSVYESVKYGGKMPEETQVDEVRYSTIESVKIINKSN
ncbi:hypothetical protein [Acetivibrio saccincola]|jgi:hypothetical protein|uniref:DUF4129 domain-containing protein n=1 Tax=Acetivibrio saccincola TaxID=1677857 RepID=A0A2K9EPA6_9FIRM|nr:hypothetical protein [Acetivibrio saccincola]AUG58461.1 hypothetical protein HVS_12940 [Acetivibrio saccincola]NLW26079.1 hypothetical protein [Acetivibrio saccincola]PQQ66338.1 hypothetical protein B9R14_05955 [Acetivibrio saccincola]HOA96160.1 hypothetical protein [Acetivibrio saccincola]HQD28293.1 hypothetical protein [Acetivibrio saccincola]